MKTYKLKSSAVRAAKKEMGDNWMDFATIESQGEEFVIQLKPTQAIAKPSPELAKSIQLAQVLADQAQAEEERAAKKAEIESRKPVHIPAKLPSALVASESAPESAPALPAFMKKAPPKEEEVPKLTEAQYQHAALSMAADMELPEEAKMGDQAANLASVNVDPLRPRLSSCELPTKKVWHIADSMPGAKRKEVIEECVRQGIAYGTARTQYQHWFKTTNDCKSTPIAVIGADGKPYIPAK